ncbi:hypothetical protein MESS2_1070015 [Mesorhizobium metallidurans STM 2683]|uniref:Uncharacterized protein n=1 Tax=Mesorhizobium metallidurans STM 2683 TaxID=1297569 RepID=M5EUU6_9HYPH|nr:hypothetical protein MESS2_1070015 [Mesorhizobium metallidurans STM 2683]
MMHQGEVEPARLGEIRPAERIVEAPEKRADRADRDRYRFHQVEAAEPQQYPDDGIKGDLDAERPIDAVDPGVERNEQSGADEPDGRVRRPTEIDEKQHHCGDRRADPDGRRQSFHPCLEKPQRRRMLGAEGDDEAADDEEYLDTNPSELDQPAYFRLRRHAARRARRNALGERPHPEAVVVEHHHDGGEKTQDVDAAECGFLLSHAVPSEWPPNAKLRVYCCIAQQTIAMRDEFVDSSDEAIRLPRSEGNQSMFPKSGIRFSEKIMLR